MKTDCKKEGEKPSFFTYIHKKPEKNPLKQKGRESALEDLIITTVLRSIHIGQYRGQASLHVQYKIPNLSQDGSYGSDHDVHVRET